MTYQYSRYWLGSFVLREVLQGSFEEGTVERCQMVAVQLAGNLEDLEFRDTDFQKIIFVLGAVGLL